MPDKPKQAETTTRPAGSSASGTDILNASAAGEIRDPAAAPEPSVPRIQPAPTRPEVTPVAEARAATELRQIALPAAYWQAIEGLAERGGVTLDVWLERYLRQFGR